jgi:hypothetical protein
VGIDDQATPAGLEQFDNEPPAQSALPAWVDESTVAVPLAELFGDDGDE